MKRVIFTSYDDIKTTADSWNSNYYAKMQVEDYWDRLLENKKEYAEKIGVDFKFFHNTMGDFEVDYDLEFTKVNLYKHKLFADLAEEYDEVLYIDMDVIFNTDENIFDELDLSKGIHIKDQDYSIISKNIKEILFNQVGARSPTIKYHITRDLLDDKEDSHVMNTGLMIGKSEHIKQIKYLERIPELIKRVNDIKNQNLTHGDTVYLRMYYYPNNESLFSAIMEMYEVPYVLMEEEWHTLIGSELREYDWDKIKVAHFISKKFNAFYKDKTKCIYSIYIEIPDDKLDNPRGHYKDPVNKSMRTKQRLMKYKEQLEKNHREYAELCGATYINYGWDEEYEEFRKRFGPEITEYNIINFYKIWLLDKLTHEYDLVLYVDYDVYFADTWDAFELLKGEHGLCCDINDAFESGINIKDRNYFKFYNKDFRNPQAKYWNAHALLQEEDLDGDNWVYNTGIMMTSRAIMDKLDYFSDLDDIIETMTEIKEFSMYPDQIRASFGYDNETIMSYKCQVNNVPVARLDEKWHYKHDFHELESYEVGTEMWERTKYELEMNIKSKQIQFIHFISKNFSILFED